MPAQQCVGFQDQQCVLPVFDGTGEKHQPQAVGLRERGLFDLALKDDELLTEESVFGDEVGPTACEVYSRAENNRVKRGLREVEEGLFKWRSQMDHPLDEQMQDGIHVG